MVVVPNQDVFNGFSLCAFHRKIYVLSEEMLMISNDPNDRHILV